MGQMVRLKVEVLVCMELDHLARFFKQNGYPANFIRNTSVLPTQETTDTSSHDEEQEKEEGPL